MTLSCVLFGVQQKQTKTHTLPQIIQQPSQHSVSWGDTNINAIDYSALA